MIRTFFRAVAAMAMALALAALAVASLATRALAQAEPDPAGAWHGVTTTATDCRNVSENSDATPVELPDLNHKFQTASMGGPGGYAQIDETVAPSLYRRWRSG